jgi:hypothetical protein
VTTTDKLVYVIAAIVVLVVVATLVWMGYVMWLEPRIQPVPTLTPSPTPIPPTWTPRPTRTPRPSPTPVPPTPTSTPTPRPRPPTGTPKPPTATPMPAMTHADAAYLQAVADVPTCFVNAEVEIKLLIQEMARNPYVRGDRSWQKDVATAKTSFFECFFRLKGLNPPPRFADVHDDLVECGKFGLLAHDEYMFAIENLVPEAIGHGNEQMEWMMDCFERMFDEIDEIFGL